MDEQLKKILRDMQEKEDSRKAVTDGIETEIKSIKTKQETEEERFAGKRDKDGNWLKEGGIYDDINAGLYNNTTEGQMQKIIDEELQKIKQKYDIQRAELNKKLEETKKQHEEEKASDYKEINSAIKDYHLEMLLAVNKANKELTEIEAERDAKIKEVDKKIAEKQAERNAKIQEIDKQIAEKEAAQTHLIMQNRNFMDIEASKPSGDIKALGEAIERLKYQKETMSSEEIDQLNVEKNSITNEYASKLKAQSDRVQYYSQQKEKASKFIGSIRLSEKSIDEIYDILFGNEKEVGQNQTQEQPNPEQPNPEQPNPEQPNPEQPNPEQPNTEQPKTTQPNQAQTAATSPTQPATAENISSPNTESKKFSYEFSIKGIKYDGQDISIDSLLQWYDDYKNDIDEVINDVIEDKDDAQYFLTHSDKLIYLSIISKGSTKADNGKIVLDDKTKERLKTYYNIWDNPKGQEESNMNITYDLKGLSIISRLFNKSQLTDEEVTDIKNSALRLRNRKNVSIVNKGLFTKLQYKIMDMIENPKNIKKIEAKTKGVNSNQNSHESFVDRLDPENPEYTQVNVTEVDTPSKIPEKTNGERE